MKKIFNWRFFLLIVGVLLGGAVLMVVSSQKKMDQFVKSSLSRISPTPMLVMSTSEIINQSKVTDGMRQFVSKEYGFSFFYPYDWQILDEPNVKGTEIQKINTQGMGFSISLRINDNPQELSLENYAKNQAFSLSNGTREAPEKITIANLQGYRLHNLPEGLLLTLYLPYKEKDKILYIFAGGEFSKSAQTVAFYNRILDNFLNSLKFNY